MKKINLILLVSLITSFCHARLTLDDILDQSRLKLRDYSTTVGEQHFSSATLTIKANLGQIDLIDRSLSVMARYFITTSSTSYEYSLPSDFLKPIRVSIIDSDYVNDTAVSTTPYKRLGYTTLNKLDEDMIEWEDTDNSEPTHYYIRYTTTTTNYIGLWPPPDSDYDGAKYLRVEYAPVSVDMDDLTDVPFFSLPYMYPYHELLVLYVTVSGLEDDGFFDQAAYFYKKYEIGIERMIKELNIQPDRITQIRPKSR